jgi:hypothetical protein
MKKALVLGCTILLAPSLASAQIRQVSSTNDAKNTVNFTVGFFALKGLDSRVTDDVLLNELLNPFEVNGHPQPLLFTISDLNSVPFGGEYLLGIGPHFEAGVGLAYSQKTAHSVYANLTHSNGDEVMQDLKLRQVPVTFTGRFLLLPRGSKVEPYIGAGIVAIRWKYSETGEFIDEFGTIYPGVYTADGTAAGPTVLFGARFPFGPMVAGAEGKWQKAEGSGLLAQGFPGDKIDLGGWAFNFTFGARF